MADGKKKQRRELPVLTQRVHYVIDCNYVHLPKAPSSG